MKKIYILSSFLFKTIHGKNDFTLKKKNTQNDTLYRYIYDIISKECGGA